MAAAAFFSRSFRAISRFLSVRAVRTSNSTELGRHAMPSASARQAIGLSRCLSSSGTACSRKRAELANFLSREASFSGDKLTDSASCRSVG